MKRSLSCMAAALLLGSVMVSGQTKAKATNVPEIPFQSVPDFIKLPPDLYLGESMGVATNSKGHFFVFHRSGDTRLFEFETEFVRGVARDSTVSSSRTRSRRCREQLSGRWTRGRTWSSSSTPPDGW